MKHMMWMHRLRYKLFPANLIEVVTEMVENHPAEIKYLDPYNQVVGYWAYGSWDPHMPYQGDIPVLWAWPWTKKP